MESVSLLAQKGRKPSRKKRTRCKKGQGLFRGGGKKKLTNNQHKRVGKKGMREGGGGVRKRRKKSERKHKPVEGLGGCVGGKGGALQQQVAKQPVILEKRMEEKSTQLGAGIHSKSESTGSFSR